MTGYSSRIQGRQQLQVPPVRHRRNRRGDADDAERDVARDPPGRVLHNENLSHDPMSGEEPLLVCDPEREVARAHDEVGDRDLRLGGDTLGTGEKPKKTNDNNQVQERIQRSGFHEDPSSNAKPWRRTPR